jgi:hypothetical protein
VALFVTAGLILGWVCSTSADERLIYAAARDVTEHKAAAEQLERYARDLELAQEAAVEKCRSAVAAGARARPRKGPGRKKPRRRRPTSSPT